jgi:hypothetical protein
MKQLSCISIFILLTGCASSENYFYRASLQPSQVGNFFSTTLQAGMTEDDVLNIYGKPYKIYADSKFQTDHYVTYIYFYQGPLSEGRFLSKELVIVFKNLLVVNYHINERVILRYEYDSRPSNHFIQFD